MAELKRALVAVRRDEDGLPLTAVHARYVAQRLKAEIALASCIFDSAVDWRLGRGDPVAAAAQAGMVQNEQERLERLAQSLRDWGAVVSTRVLWGQPVYATLLREVERWDAYLLIVGAHDPRLGVPHTRLTETDWQLMRLAPCPILLVKNPEFDGYERVLAAIDPLHRHAEPSGLDRAVLSAARSLARALDAELSVVHAFPDPDSFVWASAVEVLPGVFYGTENMESVHRQAAGELASAYGVTPERVYVRPGEAAEVIAEVAALREAELIVIGSVARSRVEQAILGSTAEVVAASVGADLLLVPAPRDR